MAANRALSDQDQETVERLVAEFAQQWRVDLLPQTVAALPTVSPWRTCALTELIKVDLQGQWALGRWKLVESYMEEFPELGQRDEVPVSLLEAEFVARKEVGGGVDLSEYVNRFPVQFKDLCQLVGDHETCECIERDLSAGSTLMLLSSPASGESLPEESEQVGRYRLIKRLGKGGMGSVYLAEDVQLGRRVALKVSDIRGSARALKRFQREARSLALLDHPNICSVYDYGISNGVPYLVMAYIPGQSLEKLVQPEGMPPREAVAILKKLATAAQVAHNQGILHRDLKPSNIMMKETDDGLEPVIVDFGLARREDPAEETLSLTGQTLGTVAYMPLEQLNNDREAMGPACDIYPLGVILYELLTGRRPFVGKYAALVAQKERHEFPRLRSLRPDVPPELEAICLKAMAKHASDRYASMSALAAALSDYLDPKPRAVAVKKKVESSAPSKAPAATAPVAAEKAAIPPQAAPAPREATSPFTGMVFVLIHPGTFSIGSTGKEGYEDEQAGTNRLRRITRPFWLGKYTVTQEEYQKVVGNNPSRCQGEPRNPVEQASWLDAVGFCNALSINDGLPPFYAIDGREVSVPDWSGAGYRLPTEAEWEYACRAGSTKPFSFGESEAKSSEFAWFKGNSEGRPRPVGQKQPNAWGLFDMHGNVWEWCWDGYDSRYYRESPVDDPTGPPQATDRVLRGGGWNVNPRMLRSAIRFRFAPDGKGDFLGFRVARNGTDLG